MKMRFSKFIPEVVKKMIKKTSAYNLYYRRKIKNNYKKAKFLLDHNYKNLNIQDIFKDTYFKQRWGKSTDRNFYSGVGSYSTCSEKYVEFISDYIKNNKITSIIDLGCGDFNVGKKITEKNPFVKYTGVDIFKEIIDYNNSKFSSENISFIYVDTTSQQAPRADLLLVRQVFQHLSNNTILKIINTQFNLFKKIIVTEHYPESDLIFSYNLDKPDGPGNRVSYGSGVFLDKEPFNLKLKEVLRCKNDKNGFINSYEIL